MIVYCKDKSGKLPRKPAKRTKPRYGDSFPVRSSGVPVYRSDMDKPQIVSANSGNKPFHPINSVFARPKELQEVKQHINSLNSIYGE